MGKCPPRVLRVAYILHKGRKWKTSSLYSVEILIIVIIILLNYIVDKDRV